VHSRLREIKVMDATVNKEYARANDMKAQNQYESEFLSFSDLIKGTEIITSPHRIRDDAKKNISLEYFIVMGIPRHCKSVVNLAVY